MMTSSAKWSDVVDIIIKQIYQSHGAEKNVFKDTERWINICSFDTLL